MNDFDEILEQCLDKIASGESTLEECLARNPNHSAELLPYLVAADRLKRGREVKPSPLFAARLRSELMQKTKANPRPTPKTWGFPVFFSTNGAECHDAVAPVCGGQHGLCADSFAR
jgi:hypothetical protein